MKKIIFSLLCLFLIIGIYSCQKSYDPGDWSITPYKPEPDTGGEDDGPTTTFKVMSINMNIGTTAANFDVMKDYIKEYNPDFVFLRQVDSSTNRSGKIDRPKALADALGMTSFFKKNIDYQTGGFGNAVLSKYPIKETFGKHLSRIEGNNAELRSIAMLKAEITTGNEVYFAGTELDPSVADNRAVQVVDLINITDRLTAPTILVGNLNEQESANGPVIGYLKGSFTFGCLGTGCAWNAPKAAPNGVYDYIMFKDKESNLSIINYGTFPKSANNFLPMVAEFRLKLKE